MTTKEKVKEPHNISITIDISPWVEIGEGIALRTAEKMLANLDEKLYTRAEMLKKFDICSATLWRWEKLGLINGKKIGNRKYYLESELQSLTSEKGGEENV